MIRRLLTVAAAAGAVVGALTVWALSGLPRGSRVGSDLPPTHVTMAYHVHTSRSDGTGSVEDVAAAAAEAGTDVVVLTDHGDGTRATDPPRYVGGVLVIDAAEIGTWAGHYVALGGEPSPYPLGGEPAAVVDDVRALGGRGIVAHPASARDGLKWRAWDAPFDGLEWLNADSVWRDGTRELWSALLTYWWRPVDTLTALVHRPTAALAEWDRQTARRPVVGLAAHDAHARIGVGGFGEPYDGAVAFRAPGYGVLFSTFTNVVVLDGPLSADAPSAAGQVLDALSRGRTYAVMTGQRAAPVVRFTAEASADRRASVGEHLESVPGTTIAFHGAVDAPPTATSRLVCGGTIATSAPGGRISWTTTMEAGACRLEVDLGAPFRTPWVVTNPIYARAELVKSRAPLHLPDAPRAAIAASRRPDGWTSEHSAEAAAVAVAASPPDGPPVEFRWTLGTAPNQYAAIRLDAPANLVRADRVIVRAAADRPMRLWVQLRSPAEGGRRWGRSLRLVPGATLAPHEVPLDGLVPLDGQGGTVPLDAVTAILLVVDTVYTRPGESGVVRLDGLELTMAPPATP